MINSGSGAFVLILFQFVLFCLSLYNVCVVGYESLSPPRPASIAAPVWQDRTIASSKLRLLEYSAFLETQKDRETVGAAISFFLFFHFQSSIACSCCFTSSPLQDKHLFVHIGPSNPGYNDPVLESIDVRQIYDKFSEKKGGLKELYEKGPHNAFFLVKFWVSAHIQSSHS